jgi:hypothetical protein
MLPQNEFGAFNKEQLRGEPFSKPAPNQRQHEYTNTIESSFSNLQARPDRCVLALQFRSTPTVLERIRFPIRQPHPLGVDDAVHNAEAVQHIIGNPPCISRLSKETARS